MSVAILAAPALPYAPSSSYLIPPLSSLSSCASGVYSVKLVDLLLAAHAQVTEREVDFTILVLNAAIHMASHPYAPTPAYFLKKATDVPDLVQALASSTDFKSTVPGDTVQDSRLVFECLVRRITFQYCYRELSFTAYSYQQAVEYLTERPIELAVKHTQYRASVAQLEREAKAAAVAEVRKRKTMARSASSIALSMFKLKKKRLSAK
ncbi:hypothetical protein FRC07_008181 [Ceratobasidium sp. 392]|nr:hypothetical protein FRC07_008181 [Ceratobasidium sp. 392]